MRSTKILDLEKRGEPLSVDLVGLQAMLGTGKQTARLIGNKAGATFVIGRRRLYSVAKVKAYIQKQAEAQAAGRETED